MWHVSVVRVCERNLRVCVVCGVRVYRVIGDMMLMDIPVTLLSYKSTT